MTVNETEGITSQGAANQTEDTSVARISLSLYSFLGSSGY